MRVLSSNLGSMKHVVISGEGVGQIAEVAASYCQVIHLSFQCFRFSGKLLFEFLCQNCRFLLMLKSHACYLLLMCFFQFGNFFIQRLFHF